MELVSITRSEQTVDCELVVHDGENNISNVGTHRPIKHHLVTIEDACVAQAPSTHVEQECARNAIDQESVEI